MLSNKVPKPPLGKTRSKEPIVHIGSKASQTCANCNHWLKKVMQAAGVDTRVFSAHSTRGASTSKARSVGVTTADILGLPIGALPLLLADSITDQSSLDNLVMGCQEASTRILELVSFERIPCSKHYVVVVYQEPPKYNYRFLEDSRNPMRRMNCTRRWRIHYNNIVSYPTLCGMY